jgi:hypothetical protein
MIFKLEEQEKNISKIKVYLSSEFMLENNSKYTIES